MAYFCKFLSFEIMFAFVTISRLLTQSSVSLIRSLSGHVRSVHAQTRPSVLGT